MLCATTEWISAREASRRLAVSPCSLVRIVQVNDVRRRVVPGAPLKFHAGDIDALAAAAVQGEGVQPLEALAS